MPLFSPLGMKYFVLIIHTNLQLERGNQSMPRALQCICHKEIPL